MSQGPLRPKIRLLDQNVFSIVFNLLTRSGSFFKKNIFFLKASTRNGSLSAHNIRDTRTISTIIHWPIFKGVPEKLFFISIKSKMIGHLPWISKHFNTLILWNVKTVQFQFSYIITQRARQSSFKRRPENVQTRSNVESSQVNVQWRLRECSETTFTGIPQDLHLTSSERSLDVHHWTLRRIFKFWMSNICSVKV